MSLQKKTDVTDTLTSIFPTKKETLNKKPFRISSFKISSRYLVNTKKTRKFRYKVREEYLKQKMLNRIREKREAKTSRTHAFKRIQYLTNYRKKCCK